MTYGEDWRYFEDVTPGRELDVGHHEFTAAGIREFAERWDPLPVHVRRNPPGSFDEPIASGFHTLCATTRLAVEAYRDDLALVAGMGIEDLRWVRPVRAGDRLDVTLAIPDKRPSESRPDAGVIREAVEGRVDGDLAIEYVGSAMVERRSPASA